MSAATRVIASDGLGGSTAAIAKAAGVSNGSLFTYFETKTDLFNQLFVELKTEMATEALRGLPTEGGTRDQMRHLWLQWLRWATSSPDKRRALAQLSVSDEITAESREIGHRALAGVGSLLARSRENGKLRDAPLSLIIALMAALAEATTDFMIQNPTAAEEHAAVSFEAMWAMLA